MKSVKKKLRRAIDRSQAAYGLYITDKKYYQALRIKKANEKVYELLESFLYVCEDQELEVIHQYLFHLEDWFEQFEDLEKKQIQLDSEFVFTRFDASPEFPKTIVNIL